MPINEDAVNIMNPANFIAASKISKGLQYQHNYLVYVNLGNKLNISNEVSNSTDLMWNAVEVSVPGVTMGVSGVILGGRTRYAAQERSDQDLRITFLEDSNMSARRFFDKWIALAYDPYTRIRKFPDDMKAIDIIISTFDQSGNVTYFDEFIEPFPFEINDLDYNRSNYDIVKTRVTFKYKQHLVKSIDETSWSIQE